jgi:hypothetical protein
MAICDCGNETGRLKVHLETPDGRPLPPGEKYSTCPKCKPEDFDRFMVAADKRFWANWEVNPNEYDTLVYVEDGERVPIIKDWAKGEFEQEIIDAPEAAREEAILIEKKRAFARERNKQPLTAEQAKRTADYYRAQIEDVERMMRAQESGLVLP